LKTLSKVKPDGQRARKELISRGLKFRKVRDINLAILPNYVVPYLAGLFDGEGTFALKRSGTKNLRFQPVIRIGMTHEETIAFAAGIFGVTYDRRVSKRPYTKDMFILGVTTEKEIRQIATALIPFSRTRHKQLELALEYLSLKDKLPEDKHDSRSKDVLLRMIDVYIEVAKLNHRGKPCDYEAIREKLRKKL
jgi:hypothetical protein